MNPVAVTFYGDVGFDRTYTHVVDFTSESERTAYFAQVSSTTVSGCAYNRFEKTLALIMDYGTACGYCYCSFPIDGRTVYAWVDTVSVINDGQNTAYTSNPLLNITISIDPWQTFLFDFTVGESFVERQHLDRFVKGGGERPYPMNPIIDENSVNYYTVDSCDISDRIVPSVSASNLFHDVSGGIRNTNHACWVAITVVENDTAGADIPVYFVPVIFGEMVHNIFEGTWKQNFDSPFLFGTTYDGTTLRSGPFTAMDFYYFLDGSFFTRLGFDPDSAVSAYVIPFSPFPLLSFTTSDGIVNAPDYEAGEFALHTVYDDDLGQTFGYYETVYNTMSYVTAYQSFVFDAPEILTMPVDGASIDDFATYTCEPTCAKPPYRKICLMGTDGRLSDCLNTPGAVDNGGMADYEMCLMVSPESCVVRIFPTDGTAVPGQWVDVECQQLAIPTDAWQSYVMQNQGTDEMVSQYNTIKNILKSITSLGTTAVGSSSGIYSTKDTLSGASSGLSSLIDTADPVVQQMANEGYAKAKANNIQVVGNVRALSATLDGSNGQVPSLYLVQLTADPQTLRMANSRLFKVGYECNWFDKPNLRSRKRFNYIKARNARIEGALNNDWKSSIQAILSKGVTIWHGNVCGPTDIGDYSTENIETSLQ